MNGLSVPVPVVSASTGSSVCASPRRGCRAMERLLGSAVLLLVQALAVHGATVTWTNAGGGTWSTPGNWSGGAVPAAGDTVQIALNGTYTVTVDIDATLTDLSVGAGAGAQTLLVNGRTLTVNGTSAVGTNGRLTVTAGTLTAGGAITVDGILTQSGGTVTASGPVTVNSTLSLQGGTWNGTGAVAVNGTLNWTGGTMGGAGTTTVAATGTLNLSGSSRSLNSRSLVLAGNTIWTGGELTLSNAATVVNQGTFDARVTGGEMIYYSGNVTGISFTNTGTLKRTTATGTQTAWVTVPFVNEATGLVHVQTAQLYLARGGTLAGEVRADTGTVCVFVFTSPFTLVNGAQFTGAGTHRVADWNGAPAVSVAAGGTATCAQTATLDLQAGTLGGAGTFVVNGPMTWTGGTLGGGGTVRLAATGSLTLSGGAKAVNNAAVVLQGNSAWSAGDITLSNGGTITNQAGATFDVRVGDGPMFYYSGDLAGISFTNHGTLKRTTATGTQTAWMLIPFVNEATGLVDVQTAQLYVGRGGTLGGEWRTAANTVCCFVFTSPFAIANGARFTGTGKHRIAAWNGAPTLTVADGATATVESGVVFEMMDGALAGGGALEFQSGSALAWSGGAMSGSGATRLASGATGTISGSVQLTDRTFANAGTVTWSGGTVTVAGTGLIDNLLGGTFDTKVSTTYIAASPYAGTTMLFRNAGTVLKTAGTYSTFQLPFTNTTTGVVRSQTGQLSLGSSGTLAGQFVADPGATIVYSDDVAPYALANGTEFKGGGTHHLAYFNGSPTLSVADGATATLAAGTTLRIEYGTITGAGTFDIQGTCAWETLGMPMTGSGTTRISAGGAVNITGGNKTVDTRTLRVAGTLNVPSNLALALPSGTLLMDGGAVTGAGPITLTGGTLSGAGTLTANITNTSGHVRPGSSAGLLTITGNYTQSAAGTLDIEIGGTAAGTQFDKLAVSGVATLDGTVAFSLINGFNPAGSDTFQVMTFGSRSGSFATYTGRDLADSRQLSPTLGATDLTVSVITPLTDLLVRQTSEADAAYAIDGEYQATPSGNQIETVGIDPTGTSSFTLRLDNDNASARTYVLKAVETAEAGWTVTYRDASSADITAALLGAGWTSPSLAAAGSTTLTVTMAPAGTVLRGTTKTTTLSAYLNGADTTVRDSVRAITRISGVEWAAAVSGNWSDASKWSTGAVPTTTDSVFIARDGTYTVTLDTNATVAGLTLGGASGTQTLYASNRTLTLNGPGTVGARGVLTLSSATRSGTGTLTVDGAMNGVTPFFDGGGRIVITANATLALTAFSAGNGGLRNHTIDNYGITTLNSTGRFDWGGTGVFNNKSGGIFDILNDGSTLDYHGGAGSINNEGVIRKTGGAGTYQFGGVGVNNLTSAILRATSGTISLNSNATHEGGQFEAETGASVRFGGGTHVFNGNSTIIGDGTAAFAYGTMTVEGTLTISANTVTLGGSAINGGGTMAVNSPVVNWSGATGMSGAGKTVFSAATTVTLTGVSAGQGGLSGRIIDNHGRFAVATASRFDWGSSVFNNKQGGILDFQVDGSSLNYPGGSPVIYNEGTVTKSGGNGTYSLDGIGIGNTGAGTILASSGTLNLNGPGTYAAGRIEAGAGATLQFGGNTHTFTGGPTVTGDGTLRLGNGAMAVNAAVTVGTATFVLAGGSITGAETLTVTSPAVNWTGPATMAGTGKTAVSAATTMTVSGVSAGQGGLSGRTIDNHGTFNVTTAQRFDWGSSVFNNKPGGILDFKVDANLLNYPGGSPVLNNEGTVRKSAGAGTCNVGSITVNNMGGTVESQSGTLGFTGSYTQTAGSTWLNGGSIQTSQTTALQGGTLMGAGTVTGSVNNTGGTVAPGSSAGLLTITGTYTQGAGGTLAIELGGTAAGTQYDRLAVTGAATLGGTVALSVIGGFTPAHSDVFTPMTFASRTGQFSTYTGTSLGDGRSLRPTLTATALTLDITVPQPDLLIRQASEADAAYAIDGEYQATPTGNQVETLVVAPTQAASFAVRLDNDSSVARTFVLKSAESAETGWTVTYRDATSADITAAVLGAGWTSPNLAAGGSTTVTIAMTPAGTVLRGTTKTATLNAHLDGTDATVRDTVRATARVSGIEWATAVDGNWSDASKWTTGAVPTATDEVLIRRDGTYTVTLTGDVTVAALTLGGSDGTQTLYTNSHDLTLNGASTVGSHGILYQIYDGLLTGPGDLTVDGRLRWASGTISGSGVLTIASGVWEMNWPGYTGDKYLDGRTVRILSGGWAYIDTGNVYLANNALIENAGGFSFDLYLAQSNRIYASGGSPGRIENTGTIEKTSGTGAGEIFVPVNNAGIMRVTSGQFNLAGGGTHSGTFTTTGADGSLRFTGGTHSLLDGVTFPAGPGKVQIVGGSVNVTGLGAGATVATGATLEQLGGTLGGAGTLTVDGTMSWFNGTMSGAGTTLIAAPNGYLSLGWSAAVGVGSHSLSGRTLRIGPAATLYWDVGNIELSNNALLDNQGTLDLHGYLATNYLITAAGAPAGRITNSGTFTRSSGTGDCVISPPLDNTGTVSVASGSLRLAGGGTHTGTFSAAAGATLRIGGGTHELGDGVSFTGAGSHLLTYAATVSTTGTNTGATVQAGTVLTLEDATMDGSGKLTVAGTLDWLSSTLTGTGSLIVSAGGALNLSSWDKTVDQRTISNSGTVSLPSNRRLTLRNGARFLHNSAALSGGGALVLESGALLRGLGSTTVSLGNTSGQVEPGASPGLLSNTGTYSQGASASLHIEIGGTTVGTQYDRLETSGTATLGGTLNVSLINAFQPHYGDTFEILRYGSRGQDFGTVNLPALGSGLQFERSINATNMVLTVVGGADLGLTQGVDNADPVVGDNVSLTVTVTNGSTLAATGVQVMDLLPAGLTFVSATPSVGTYAQDTGLWTVGGLAGGATATLQIVATPTQAVAYANTAQVQAVNEADPDSTPGNSVEAEDDQETVTVNAHGDVIWTNPAGGDWSVGTNWQRGTAPGPLDRAVISLDGTYTVTLNTSPTVAGLTLGANAGTQTLYGNGRTLTVNGTTTIGSHGAMDLRSGTFDGTGTCTNNGSVTLVTMTVGANQALANAGFLKLWGPCAVNSALTTAAGSTLRLDQGSSNTYGTVTFATGFTNHGLIELEAYRDGWGNPAPANLSVTSGTLVNATDGTIRSLLGHGGGRVLGAVLDNQGTLDLSAYGLTLSKDSAAHTNSGTITVGNGALTLSQTGTDPSFTNTGTITVAAGQSMLVTNGTFVPGPAGLSGNFEFSGATLGTGTLPAATTVVLYNAGVASGATLTCQGPVTIYGACNVLGSLVTTATTTLHLESGTRNDTGTLTLANGFTNNGLLEITAQLDGWGNPRTATLNVTNGRLVNAAGATIRSLAGAGAGRTLGAVLDNRGTLDLSAYGMTLGKAAAAHANSGTIAIGAGQTLTLDGGTLTQTAGSVTGGGALSIVNGSSFLGSGSVTADVTNAGLVGPGTSPGLLTITGSYTQTAAGRLAIEIGGTVAGAGFDRLEVSGTATLAGTLDVTLTGGFQPHWGDVFEFLTYATRAGDFGTVNGLDLTQGLRFERTANATNMRLTAVDGADLSLGLVADTLTPAPGSNVTFTLTLANAGPRNATGVQVLDLLPAGLTFVSATPATGTYASGSGLWTVGALANGTSATLQLVARADQSGAITNTAQVQAVNEADPDSTPGNSVAGEDDQASLLLAVPVTASLTVAHVGSGSTDPDGARTVTVGSAVAIAATPGGDQQFLCWVVTGNVAVADRLDDATTATVNGDGTVTARFYPQQPGAGYALDFDGANDVVNAGAVPVTASPLTIEVWFRHDGPLTGYEILVAKRGSASDYNYVLGLNAVGGLFFAWSGATENRVDTAAGIVDSDWHHVAVVYANDGATAPRIWVDGQHAGATLTNGNPVEPLDGSSSDTLIGAQTLGGGPSEFFQGRIDEVRLWGAAVTQDTLRDWLHRDLTAVHPDYANLLAYWRFDDGPGNATLLDLSPNAHDATLTSMDPASDWVLSAATLGDVSHWGTGTADLPANAAVPVTLDWTDDPGAAAISAAVQVSDSPLVTTGLPANSAPVYWEVWTAHDDGSLATDVTVTYDGITGIRRENDLHVYGRATAADPWVEIPGATIAVGADNTDGSGTVTVPGNTGSGQLILASASTFNTFAPGLIQETRQPTAPTLGGTALTTDTTPTTTWASGGIGNGNFRYQLDGQADGSWTTTTADAFTPLVALPDSPHTLYVQEQNDLGQWGPSGSYTVVVDTTAPAGTVQDGAAADVDTQDSPTTVQANWATLTDALSGVTAYEWAVGTTPGGTEIQAFTAVGTSTTASRTGLALAGGNSLWVAVRATNGVDLQAIAQSDGVTVRGLPYTEDFDTDHLRDPALTTAAWSTALRHLTLSGARDVTETAASLELDVEVTPIPAARLTPTATTPAGTGITWYLSSDGGTSWTEAAPGTWVRFAAPGTDLRWRAVLTTTGLPAAPQVTRLFVEAKFDRDSDGMDDDWEATHGLDPLTDDGNQDPDTDALTNLAEFTAGTDPRDNDTDNDGMPDGWEVAHALNPLVDDAAADPDTDTLSNLAEFTVNTDPHDPDTDNDGMPDGWEVTYALNPLVNDAAADPDTDALTNLAEYTAGTDPRDNDSDNDGMPDGWEVAHALNPLVNDAAADPDTDALANLAEYTAGTDPHVPDTDGDGMPDGWEVAHALNPLVNDAAADPDSDGLANLAEYTAGTDPRDNDSDNDGMPDGWEVAHTLNPLVNDAAGDPDSDALTNLAEFTANTDPHVPDTDGDGMPDGWEVAHTLNPLVNDAAADPDTDALANLAEYTAGTDPRDNDSDNDGMPDGWEVAHTLNPLVNDAAGDPDSDALTNLAEFTANTDPHVPDTDGDGMPDGWEVAHTLNPLVNDAAADPDTDALANLAEYTAGTDPRDNDSDNDGMPDGWEVAHTLNPLVNDAAGDPDSDALTNLAEYTAGTDPHVPDTDGDGMPDGWEVDHALDPTVPNGGEDADGDTYSNLAEYHGESDPQDPTSIPGGRLIWAGQADGTAANSGYGVAWLGDGSAVVTGRFRGTMTLGTGDDTVTLTSAGDEDAWLAHYNADGSLAWALSSGGTGADVGWSVHTFADGSILLTGSFSGTATFGGTDDTRAEVDLASAGDSDVFVAKITADGDLLWAVRAGGTGADAGFALSLLPDGGCVVTGHFAGTAVFGPGEANQTTLAADGATDLFVARYAPDGTLAWAKRAGGTLDDVGEAIAATADGSALVSGSFTGTAVFGPGETNQTTLAADGSTDAFLACYNPDGTLAWARRAGGALADAGYSVDVFADGSAVVTGHFSGTAVFGPGEAGAVTLTAAGADDAFVARYEPDGALAWAVRAGGTGADAASGTSALDDGGALVTGSFEGAAIFGPGQAGEVTLFAQGATDVFLARYDGAGVLQWVRQGGGTLADVSHDLATRVDGTALVTGSFSGTAQFGFGEPSAVTMSATAESAFVASFVHSVTLWGVHTVSPAADSTGVELFAGLSVTIDQVPTALREIPHTGADSQPGGPAYTFLMAEHQVTVRQYVAFLNDLLATPGFGGQTPAYADATTGNLYFSAALTADSLLFGLAENNASGAFDYGLTYTAGGAPYGFDAAFADYPIVGVTWYGALQYANGLSRAKGLPPAAWAYLEGTTPADWRPAHLSQAAWTDGLSAAERQAWLDQYPDAFRLPMDQHAREAAPYNEFYKAAAWDSVTATNQDLGTSLYANAWEEADAYNGPVASAAGLPNGFGLDHALGNVWVWMTDTFAAGDASQRTIRGWSWWNSPADLRENGGAAFRWGVAPAAAYCDVGLRVVTGRDYQVEIEMATDPTFDAERDLQQSGLRTTRTWYPDLQPGTTYYWRVRATYPDAVLPSSTRWFGPVGDTHDPGYSTFTTTRSGPRQVTIPVRAGWNLVSSPLVPLAIEVSRGVAPRTLTFWGWDRAAGVYVAAAAPDPGSGYWFHAVAAGSLVIRGTPVNALAVVVGPGWNLVGVDQPISPLDFTGLRAVYDWNATAQAYRAEHVGLELYKGYWVLPAPSVESLQLGPREQAE